MMQTNGIPGGPRKPRLPPKPPALPCKHQVLFFEQGGLYVVCKTCKRAWQAMNEQRLIPDFYAINQGLTDQDVRRDPLAPVDL